MLPFALDAEDFFIYLLGDPFFYEPPSRRTADKSHFIDLVTKRLPSSWSTTHDGIWCYCAAAVHNQPTHGWKIHVSATLENAAAILVITSQIAVRNAVSYKFAADRMILTLMNRKRWPRSGSGKFITMYPNGEAQCRVVLEELYKELVGYAGPYILSDRRYRDSKVLHYRYGGFVQMRRANVLGLMVPVIPTGSGVRPDLRLPLFMLPEGVTDPFATVDESQDDDAPGTLCDGRYIVERALTFSNTGGVYIGYDTADRRRVILKEARPYTAETGGRIDATSMLQKEYRLLRFLEGSGIAPQPIELFTDWEHLYMAEEFVTGETLREHMVRYTPALRSRPTREHSQEFVNHYCAVHAKIALMLHYLHEHEIHFGDLSPGNVIASLDAEAVRLVDFEGAWQRGIDEPVPYFTPGFASPQVRAGETPTAEDDRYALGALMLYGVFPVGDLMHVKPEAHHTFLRAWRKDLGLPAQLTELIGALLSPNPERRPQLEDVADVLSRMEPVSRPDRTPPRLADSELDGLIRGIASYIHATTTLHRSDRLFPASWMSFETNPVNIAYGAAGIASVLHRLEGSVDPQIIDWIGRRPLSADNCPPGLHVGAAGIGWVLSQLGNHEAAADLLSLSRNHPLLFDDPDLFYGAAGVGLAHLRMFLDTKDDFYLQCATEIARFLLNSRVEDRDGCYWPKGGQEFSGIAHGGSGISLFLLYLYLITGDHACVDVGRMALARVVANGRRTPEGGLSWRMQEAEPTVIPCWRYGSAGIGSVLLRYRAALDDTSYDQILADIDLDTDRRYSVFCGYHNGLAGFGDFYLDCVQYGPNPKQALAAARRVLGGVLAFRLDREEGIAFPGDNRQRISCDFATGSAGIGYFVHRLAHGGAAAFMLDELVNARLAARQIGREALVPTDKPLVTHIA